MIQIYAPENTNFSQNGDAVLWPTSAEIHVILNGAWTASLSHPIDQDGRWKYIEENAVVKMPSFLEDDQLFRIKKRTVSDSGVEAELEPIFYDSIGDCFLVNVRPTNDNGQQALDMMTAVNSKYSGRSNITKISTAYYEFKNLMEAINGEDDNAFVKRWGGEILFDNFEVIVDEQVGADHGVELRYGKNLPTDGLTEDVDMTEVVTRIYPKAYNGYTMTGNGYVDSDLIDNYPTVLAKTITFDDVKMAEDAQEDDEENGVIVCQNQTELDAALTQRCQEQYAAGLDKPKVTLTADMVLLQNTEQYKDFQMLERVSLGDTIHCYHKKLGITTEARAIELTYDAILKKVTAVVLGDFEYNYFNNVSSSVNRIDGAIRPDGSVVAEQIQGFINGAKSQLRLQNTIAEKQDVRAILFEDLDEASPTFGAMALGTQGLQISKERTPDGSDWVWTTALTSAGLVANIIVAGLLSDATGANYWNLNTGDLNLSGSFNMTGGAINIQTSADTSKIKLQGTSYSGDQTEARMSPKAIVFENITDSIEAQMAGNGIFLLSGGKTVATLQKGGLFVLGDNGESMSVSGGILSITDENNTVLVQISDQSNGGALTVADKNGNMKFQAAGGLDVPYIAGGYSGQMGIDNTWWMNFSNGILTSITRQ